MNGGGGSDEGKDPGELTSLRGAKIDSAYGLAYADPSSGLADEWGDLAEWQALAGRTRSLGVGQVDGGVPFAQDNGAPRREFGVMRLDVPNEFDAPMSDAELSRWE